MNKKEIAQRNRRRGKANERALAKRLQARRVGTLGKHDLERIKGTDLVIAETKNKERFVGESWMRQIERIKRENQDSRIAIVIVHLHNHPHSKDIVMMRLPDFEDLFGKLKFKDEDGGRVCLT